MDPVSPIRSTVHAGTGGMLAIWHDVAPSHAAAVREWYGREHHCERLAIPGFRAVRRFDRVSGTGADVFAAYRVESPDVLRSAAYLARVNAPSEWTRDVMRHFRRMSRTVCSVSAQAGRAEGGYVATLASADGSLDEPAAACAQLLRQPGVLQVTALVAAGPAAGPASAEHAVRGGPDTQVAWALLVDADDLGCAEHALHAAQEHTACREAAQFAVYRLAFSAFNPA